MSEKRDLLSIIKTLEGRLGASEEDLSAAKDNLDKMQMIVTTVRQTIIETKVEISRLYHELEEITNGS